MTVNHLFANWQMQEFVLSNFIQSKTRQLEHPSFRKLEATACDVHLARQLTFDL